MNNNGKSLENWIWDAVLCESISLTDFTGAALKGW